jgi:NADH-quinone oxidoreductase subunit E
MLDNWLSTELMDKVAEIIQYYQLRYMRLFLSIRCTIKTLLKSFFEFCHTSPCCLNGTEDLMDYTCEN